VKTILTNKLLAARDFGWSADQSHRPTQLYSTFKPFTGDGIWINKLLAAYDYELSAHQGFARTHLQYGFMFVEGEAFFMNKMISRLLSWIWEWGNSTNLRIINKTSNEKKDQPKENVE
jgi:hypothetical protein